MCSSDLQLVANYRRNGRESTIEDAAEAIRRFELVFHRSSWGVQITDGETMRITDANPAFERMHGYESGEMLGLTLANCVPSENHALMVSNAERLDREGQIVFESLHVRKDGSTFPVLVDATAVKDAKDSYYEKCPMK